MAVEFNKDRLFSNIYYLIAKRGLKIGDVESAAGVSTGYIARTSKDEKSKPGIEFVMKVAEVLWVTSDDLLRLDLRELTEAEKYLKEFLTKLLKDTNEAKLDWKAESAEDFEECYDVNGYSTHPLLDDLRTGLSCGYHLKSKNFGDEAFLNGQCFSLRMKNNVQLYYVNLYGDVEPEDGGYTTREAKEIWLTNPRGKKQFICDDQSGDYITSLLNDLYKAISDYLNRPHIHSEFRKAIDAFMRDDLTTDEGGEEISEDISDTLPF